MKGYKYNTPEETNADIKKINDALGIPVSDEAITRTYVNSLYENNGSYYIIHDATIEGVLGAPIDIATEQEKIVEKINATGFNPADLMLVFYYTNTNIISCVSDDGFKNFEANIDDIDNNQSLIDLKNNLINNHQAFENFFYYRKEAKVVLDNTYTILINDLPMDEKIIFEAAGHKCMELLSTTI